MRTKIFRSIFTAALIAMALTSALVVCALYGFFNAQSRAAMRTDAEYITKALVVAEDPKEYLNSLRETGTRITLVGKEGAVVYDTQYEAAALGNHLDRPEIKAAMTVGAGESTRFSSTLGENTLYYAVRLQDGTVLRLANTQRSIFGLLFSMITAFLLILSAIAILCAIVAGRMAKAVLQPLNGLNLEEPLDNQVYDELSPLLQRMAVQNKRIAAQVLALTEQQRAFSAVTGNMREGLAFLDGAGNILTINQSACRLFDQEAVALNGKHILMLSRNEALYDAVKKAEKGFAAETKLKWRSRCYQVLANPVPGEHGGVDGIVLLVLDVTERENGEKLRREFTANVSHELKTPLTSIAGYAEIMENGLVKPEDMRAFAGRIHEESRRLITLVEDIIKLSRLDEGAEELLFETISLSDIAKAEITRLGPMAEAKGITLSLSGEAPPIRGVRRVLHEMLGNLVDNAIKYTEAGGSVRVCLSQTEAAAVATVADTGVGIPKEHQSKVFERFYRVDQSHSKDTGGTGLGLSIVKHGAILHGARVELMSQPHEGTTVRLLFALGSPGSLI